MSVTATARSITGTLRQEVAIEKVARAARPLRRSIGTGFEFAETIAPAETGAAS